MTFKVSVPRASFDNKDNIKQLKKLLREGGRIIANDTRAMLRKSFSRSSPGNPPGRLTGMLAANVRVKSQKLGVTILDATKYALALESGANGPGKRRMEPRPFLSVAFAKDVPTISAKLLKAFEKNIRLKDLR